MKKFNKILFSIFILIISLSNTCCTVNKMGYNTAQPFSIKGLTYDNYPNVDGSTSTAPLMQLIFCKLFEYDYTWFPMMIDFDWGILPVLLLSDDPILKAENFNRLVKFSQTHQSIISLIDKKTDLSLVARKMSHDEKNYARAAGVRIIETPIALDAFIFIIHPENPVKSLSVKQIQDIYTGKITNWKEVGGNDAPINPYVRNANSGSQELMESLVMKNLSIAEFPVGRVIPTMSGALDIVSSNVNSISYTLYYYKNYMQRLTRVKTIEIEGIYPNKDSISNHTYPLTAEIYASIRSDLNRSSTAYKLYKLLQTKAGKQVISESGYIPLFR